MADPYHVILSEEQRTELRGLEGSEVAAARMLTCTRTMLKADRVGKRALDGQQEAKLIALPCSEAPEVAARWSLRLLADDLVRLEVVAAISHETVRQTRNKTRSSRP